MSTDLLDELAALLPTPVARNGTQPATDFDLGGWIGEHNLSVKREGAWSNGGYRWILNPCPWDSSHIRDEAFITRKANGEIAAGCQHATCPGKSWADLRSMLEPGCYAIKPKTCDNCGQPLTFQQDGGGAWKPYNADGSLHRCRGPRANEQPPGTSPPTSQDMVGSEVPKEQRAAPVAGVLPEFDGGDLAESGVDIEELPYLPLLGQHGFFVRGWSHLLAGYPRTGKTELLTRLFAEWTRAGLRILLLSEESQAMWAARLRAVPGNWHGHLTVIPALGYDPELLRRRGLEGHEDVVAVDTLRNLLQLTDEKDNSEVARRVGPWVADSRSSNKTLIMLHHMRKGSGEHGEGIAGAGALLGAFDIAMELVHGEQTQKNRRIVRAHARLIQTPDLLYEMDQAGTFKALGEPEKLRLTEVRARIREQLMSEWQKTADVHATLGDPQPSLEQVRIALMAEAQDVAGCCERDPDISVSSVRGKTPKWRLRASARLQIVPALDDEAIA